jgi:hypothetical protein
MICCAGISANECVGVSQVNSAKSFLALLLIGIGAFLAAASGTATAAPAGQTVAEAGSGPAAGALLHRVDTFPTCAEVRRCWRNNAGQLRCGMVTRCQVCKWVRRCTRAGCAWREDCKWGPYKPALPTN